MSRSLHRNRCKFHYPRSLSNLLFFALAVELKEVGMQRGEVTLQVAAMPVSVASVVWHRILFALSAVGHPV